LGVAAYLVEPVSPFMLFSALFEVMEQDAAVPDSEDFGFAPGAAAVPLVHEARGPHVVVAPDEMDPGARVPDAVEGLQDGVAPFQTEVGIVEPEVEDVPEQDQVIGPPGQFEQFDEAVHPMPLGFIGIQVEMGIGHDDGRRFIRFVHVA
jgi:hypothetical protein